ncbi:MAG: RNase adapter RapZ [Thioalkalivibrio sp.]
MKLIIVSGLSGSGKSVALNALEDAGYYCVDNLHLGLLSAFVRQLMAPRMPLYELAAVGVDVRSGLEELDHFDDIMAEIRDQGVEAQILFLRADEDILLRRFSETRRKHPLARKGMPLVEALRLERSLLARIAVRADLTLDTTRTNVHQLSHLIRDRVEQAGGDALSLLFQSFGFKHGSPVDSDFVFDVRCLPNPYWEPRLRALTGRDPEVGAYLDEHAVVQEMFDSLRDFLERWIPCFEAEHRSYMTVSLGCTGGQHRSVYLAERLAAHFRQTRGANVSTRHREMS